MVAAQAPGTVPLKVKADRTVLNRNRLEASGNVRFEFRDIELTCDEFEAELDGQTFEARGHVRLTQGARKFSGDRLRYNLQTQQGSIDQAHVELEGFDFTGDEIIVSGPRIVIKGATATACLSPRRHFELHSREIEIVQGQNATLRGSYLVIGGRRLVRVPKYTVNLKRSESLYQNQGLKPELFVNGRDGVFLGGRYEYQFDPGRDHFFGAATFGQSLVRGFRGGPELGYEGHDFNLLVRAKYHDTADYHFNPDLLVDIRPELLARSRPLVLIPKRLGTYLVLGYGSYLELPTKVSGTRTTFEYHLDTRAAQTRYRLFAHGSFRRSEYSGNTALSVYGFEVGTHGKLTRALEGDFVLALQEVNGRSKFQFDEVLIAKELQAKFDYRVSRGWIVPFLVRYDIERSAVRDSRFGLMRAYDCIAYGMSFDTARREFRFEGRVLLGKKR